MPGILMNPATGARRPPKDIIEIGERIPLEGGGPPPPVGVEMNTSRDDAGTSFRDWGMFVGYGCSNVILFPFRTGISTESRAGPDTTGKAGAGFAEGAVFVVPLVWRPSLALRVAAMDF